MLKLLPEWVLVRDTAVTYSPIRLAFFVKFVFAGRTESHSAACAIRSDTLALLGSCPLV